MKNQIIKLITYILDKWGYKYSISKEIKCNTIMIISNTNVGLNVKNPDKTLIISDGSKIGLGCNVPTEFDIKTNYILS